MTAAATRAQHGAASGQNAIAAKALRRVVSAVTAEELGVEASSVSVDLRDESGMLAVTASTPIRIAPLGSGAPARSASLLDRIVAAQAVIRDRSATLTGSTVSRVDLHITGADLTDDRRRLA